MALAFCIVALKEPLLVLECCEGTFEGDRLMAMSRGDSGAGGRLTRPTLPSYPARAGPAKQTTDIA